MIPNISKNGGSFRGAALYYLHDKAEDRQQAKADKPKSDERVAYVETRNLVSRDIDNAIDEMWRTAELQQQLKLASGARTSGRVCEDPVKTISLSWHPSERPTAEQQIAAADQFIERMGWAEHQAVYVGHRDTAHPHIHIILNRVHPETGRTLDDWREQKRAQDWARDYEKENGQIWCERRLLSEDEKKSAANANVPYNVVELARPSEAQFRTAEEERATRDAQEHAALKEQQKAERIAWMAEGKAAFKAARHAAYDEVRAEMRPKWREFYKESQVLRKDAEAASGSGVERALHFAKAGQWEKAWTAFDNRDSVRDGIEDVITARKAELVAEQKAERVAAQTAAVAVLKETRDAGYKDLLARQQGERASMKAAHGLGDSGAQLLRAPEPLRAGNENKDDQAPAVAIDPQSFAADGFRVRGEPVPAAEVAARAGAMVAEEPRVASTPEAPEPVKQFPDLVAGSIGSVAEYLAEQIADAITPPSPKELAARAAAAAKKAEQPPRPERDAYADQVNAAIKAAFEEAEAKRSKDYWVERDKKRDFERDR